MIVQNIVPTYGKIWALYTNLYTKAIQNGNQSDRVLSSNFWWMRNAKHVKFTEKRVLYMEKRDLIKKKCLQMD